MEHSSNKSRISVFLKPANSPVGLIYVWTGEGGCDSGFTSCLHHRTHLEHRVSKEGLQGPLLAVRLGLVLLQQLVKVSVLLAVSQDLQAVLVVPHKLLVDVQHGQQDVEQVGCKRGVGDERFGAQLWHKLKFTMASERREEEKRFLPSTNVGQLAILAFKPW